MRVHVRLDESDLRLWHLTLLQRLAALPALVVEARLHRTGTPRIGGIDSLFQLEAVLHGLNGLGTAACLAPPAFAPFLPATSREADLVIDLTDDETPLPGRVWRLTYNDLAGDNGLIAVIMDGQMPVVQLSENGQRITAGRLGTDHGGVALATYQDVAARTITLIAAAVSNGGPCALPEMTDTPTGPRKPVSGTRLAALAAKKVASRVLRQIYGLCYNSPHWRVGWRAFEGPDVFDLKAHPQAGWTALADDGKRFYADPFPIVKDGTVTLFVEDYEHRLGKGVISAVEFDASGPKGSPVPVLELDCHLSYPFVFERDGQVWMIPETCQNGTVELFRATAFPGGWVRESVLLSGLVASDVTIVDHGGQWWMFATVQDGGGAFSDALYLWSAPDFRGPWVAHKRNPVLIDIASARPAGRMVRRGDALYRPVQDCRKGYGAALGIARVTRLDEEGFGQSVEAILTPGPCWPGRRLHSLNSAGGLEFIDGSGTAPRWKGVSVPAPRPDVVPLRQ